MTSPSMFTTRSPSVLAKMAVSALAGSTGSCTVTVRERAELQVLSEAHVNATNNIDRCTVNTKAMTPLEANQSQS